MHSHGLGCVLDAAGSAQMSVGPQRIIWRAVRLAPAPDTDGRPRHDFIQQAHAVLVRNFRRNPVVIQPHGLTSMCSVCG